MKKRVRDKSLAIVAERLSGGGVEKVLDTILRHIDKHCVSITVYASHKETEYLPIDGLKYKYYFETLSHNDSRSTVLAKKLKNKIKLYIYYHFSPQLFYSLFIREKYDTVVGFLEGYATRIASGAQKDTRKIAWVHTDMEEYHWSRIAFRNDSEEYACYSTFEKVICVSKKIAAGMQALFKTGERTRILYNPIDRDAILAGAKAPVLVQSPIKGKIKLLTVGSLVSVKGFIRLLECLRKLCDDGLDLSLTIVGDGPEKEAIKDKIRFLSLEERVLLVGFKPNPYPYFANADIYVCSSFAEGFSTVITEALVLSCPIVATDCSGVREQLGNSEWGLVTLNNDDALRIGISRLASDDNLRAFYSSRAAKAGQKYSLQANLKAIETLLFE